MQRVILGVLLVVAVGGPAAALDRPGAPAPVSGPAPTAVSIVAGTQVGMGGGADTKASMLFAARVDFPVAKAELAPRFDVGIGVGSLPGESLSQTDPTTFRTLGVDLGLRQQLARALNFAVRCGIGFVNRMPGESEPRDVTARWWTCGVDFRGAAGWLYVGGGMDSRLSTTYAPTGHVKGALRIAKAESGRLKGAALYLGGEAILALRFGYWTEERRDVLLVGLVAGR